MTHISEMPRPRRIGWGIAMLLVVNAVFLLGHRAEVTGPAIFGGLVGAWMALTAALRLGRRRGWWT